MAKVLSNIDVWGTGLTNSNSFTVDGEVFKISYDVNGDSIITFGTQSTVQFTTNPNISDPLQIVNKQYVDSVAAGLDPKEAVHLAATSSVNIYSPPLQIDGHTCSIGDRILLWKQDGTENGATANGIYVWNGTSSAMTRSTDMDGTPASEVSTGNYVFVTEGNTYKGSGFVIVQFGTYSGTLVPDVDVIKWTKVSGATDYIWGTGLQQSGNTISVNTGVIQTVSAFNSAVSGTTNYVPKFTGTNTIGNSQVFDNGTNVIIGTNATDGLTSARTYIRANTTSDSGALTLMVDPNSGHTATWAQAGIIISPLNTGTNKYSYVFNIRHLNNAPGGPSLYTYYKGSQDADLFFLDNAVDTDVSPLKLDMSEKSVLIGHTKLTDATYRLEVSGTVSTTGFRMTNGAGSNKYLQSDSSGNATWVDLVVSGNGVTASGTTNYISKFTNTNVLGNSTIFDNGTFVGVNTTSQYLSERLSVNGDISMTSSAFLRFGGLARFGSSPGNSSYYTNIWSSGSGEGIIFLNYNGVNKLMTLTDSGNLGIGTASPGAKLDIYDGSLNVRNLTSTPLIAQTDADGTVTIANFRSNDGTFATSQELRLDFQQSLTTFSRISGYFQSGSTYGIKFYGSDGSGLNTTPLLTLRGDKLNGINTASPLANLHVQGVSGNNPFRVDTAGGTTSIFVNDSGNIGINNTNPTNLIDAYINTNDMKNILYGLNNNGGTSTAIRVVVSTALSDLQFGKLYSNTSWTLYGSSNDGFIRSSSSSLNFQTGGASPNPSDAFVFNVGTYNRPSAQFVVGISDSYFNTNVAIGLTAPSYKLQVSGTVSTTGFRMTNGAGSNKYLQSDASGNATWVDLVVSGNGVTASGTASYISKFTGTNTLGNSQIYDNGTNVAIGHSSPTKKLDLLGGKIDPYTSGNHSGLLFYNTNDVLSIRYNTNTSNHFTLFSIFKSNSSTVDLDDLQIYTTGTSYTSGIGYGNQSSQSLILSRTNLTNGLLLGADVGGIRLWGNNTSETMRIANNGNVGIGLTTPSKKLEVTGTASINGDFMVDTNVLFVDSTNNRVGIGTASPSTPLHVIGDVTVLGTLYATSKSFDIQHPSDPSKRLTYASLEGPENGVYVRGRLTNERIIELPYYWVDLIHEDSITVNLTSIGRSQELYVEKIENNKVFVGSPALPNCFYTVYAERKDIPKLKVE